MIMRTGDLFTTEAAYIGHGVNCKGVMGLGIAKVVREKFPHTYTAYAEVCKNGELAPGSVFTFVEGDISIVNLATQFFPGPDARYDAVFASCLKAAKEITKSCTTTGRSPVLAIPRIGCGIGGLEWDKVQTLLAAVEILVRGFQFEIWTL